MKILIANLLNDANCEMLVLEANIEATLIIYYIYTCIWCNFISERKVFCLRKKTGRFCWCIIVLQIKKKSIMFENKSNTFKQALMTQRYNAILFFKLT